MNIADLVTQVQGGEEEEEEVQQQSAGSIDLGTNNRHTRGHTRTRMD